MDNSRNRGPYEILRLPTTAGIDQVNARSRELAEQTMDKAAQVAYQKAAVAIRQNSVKRGCAQFREPPNAQYDDAVLEDFCRRHSRFPTDTKWLQEQTARFRDQECTPEYQAQVLLPQLPSPASVRPFEIGKTPQTPLRAILSPWEFFI